MTSSIRFVLSSLLLVACSGGGSGLPVGPGQTRCTDGSTFCLVDCDLGCGTSVCAVNRIAENQRLQFRFNQPIAPSSVHAASFVLRTATGSSATGSVLVDGASITFVPSIRNAGGVPSFGFQRNESYVVSIVGGARGIASVAGDALQRTFTCTVVASNGLYDEDAAPPNAALQAPTSADRVPVDAAIVVRFSEVVDTAALLQPVSASSPIQYLVRRLLPDGSGGLACSLDVDPVPLRGTPEVSLELEGRRPVTVVTLRPSTRLLASACVEVRVTADVRDLSGRAAVPATFLFRTEPSRVPVTALVEDFADATRLDGELSGGTWDLGARPPRLGGDGRHGPFGLGLGTQQANGDYVFDVDGLQIPATQTADGRPAVVTDGRFFFTDMHVPADATVRFVGTQPVRLSVRGRVDIQGRIEANGVDQGTFQCRNLGAVGLPLAGQPGTAGGPGGARGGRGGDRCLGAGPSPAFDGRNGDDVALPAGHAYAAAAAGTGGRGAPMFPAHGSDEQLVSSGTYPVVASLRNVCVGSGGGGGGYGGGGAAAQNQVGASPLLQIVPTVFAVGGPAFALLPVPPMEAAARDHFLVGGSGGGGGGSHPFLALPQTDFDRERWKAGGGGTGGGGVLAIEAGGSLQLGATGALQVRGGDGARINGDNPATAVLDQVGSPSSLSYGVPAPGGGGSGGSIVLRADGPLRVLGVLDARGGRGSFTEGLQPANFRIFNRGGDGAPGSYRLEATGDVDVQGAANVPPFAVADHVGALTARADDSGQRSQWRSLGLVYPPDWIGYQLEVDLDGDGTVDVIHRDDFSQPGAAPADDPLGPVQVLFQGARLDDQGRVDPSTVRPWRSYVSPTAGLSLQMDAATAFRFELRYHPALYPDLVVQRLTVSVRP